MAIINGGPGNDILDGGNGDDVIHGRGGHDSINAYAGSDVVYGDDGNDAISAGSGNDTIYGGSGDDFIDGGAGDDVLSGGEGNDSLMSGEGADHLYGGIGNDTLAGGASAVAGSYYGGEGDDRVEVSDQINPVLQGGTGIDTISLVNVVLNRFGRANGFEVVQVGSSIIGTAAADRLDFSVVAQSYPGRSVGVVVTAGDGDDWVSGTTANDDLNGGNGNDVLFGGAGSDELFGLDGDDFLNGGTGNDSMRGGTGNDRYYFDSYLDDVIELTNGGIDTVVSTLSFTLGGNIENLVLAGGNGLTGTGSAGANRIVGSDSAETLSGMDGNDILIGNGGRDILLGGNGDDSLSGGAAKDELTGGTGKDYFRFDALSDMLATTAAADIIHDFSQPDRDWIILARIDADSSTVADDAFHFVGTTAFSSTAGELRYQVIAGNTYVSGDVNGDATADFMIRLDGVQTLTAADFAL